MEVVTEEKTAETPAPIIEEKSESTADRLARITEKKPEPENKKVDTSFFGSDDDFEKSEEKKFETTEEKKKDASSPADEKKPARDTKLTAQAMKASASTAVGMLDMTLQTILTPIHGWKFKKKFKKEEVLKLEDLVDAELDKIEAEEDLKLRKKWDRLFKKYEKKKDAVALTDKEKTDLEGNFVTYFEHTQKSLPPEYLIYMGLANVVGKRVVDLVVE